MAFEGLNPGTGAWEAPASFADALVKGYQMKKQMQMMGDQRATQQDLQDAHDLAALTGVPGMEGQMNLIRQRMLTRAVSRGQGGALNQPSPAQPAKPMGGIVGAIGNGLGAVGNAAKDVLFGSQNQPEEEAPKTTVTEPLQSMVPPVGGLAPMGNPNLSVKAQERIKVNAANKGLGISGNGMPPQASNISANDPTLQAILNYTKDPKNLSQRQGIGGVSERQKYLAMAHQIDPTYDESQYPVKAALRKSFTSGPDAKNITSLNTAVEHLETLSQAAEGLGNRSFPLWNSIANTAETASGDPRVVKFNAAANAVENEMANVFKGTGATDQEVKEWRASLSPNQSPEQIKGSINEMIALMGGRLDALHGKYEQGLGKPSNFEFLQPKTKQILQRLGSNIAEPSAAPNPGMGGGNQRDIQAAQRVLSNPGAYTPEIVEQAKSLAGAK